MAAVSETNSLTMKLLALASYCEGPKAQEIKNVIAQLPAAYYRERTAVDDEIGRLRKDNRNLKQRIAFKASALRQPARPPSPPRSNWNGREPAHTGGSGDWRDIEAAHALKPSSSVTSRHDSMHTPPLPRSLFPETTRPSFKRPRTETSPPSLKRPRPVCTGCFQNSIQCNGRSECSACRGRGYGCEYGECWEGRYCADATCTRLHPEQWSGKEEPRRIVKTKG